jgi:MSHA pilin protein MshC
MMSQAEISKALVIVNRQIGFTLIELVATIMVIAVLSVTVLPKFSGRSGLAEYALRDELMSLAQQAQQRAMFDQSGACYRLQIQSGNAELQRNGLLINSLSRLNFEGDYNGLSATTSTLYFDGLGNLLMGGSSCTTSSQTTATFTVAINGGNTIAFIIHPTGYMQRQG